MVAGAVAYLLASVPLWRRFFRLVQGIRVRGKASEARKWRVVVPTVVVAFLLCLLGLVPSLLLQVWPGSSQGFVLPSLRSLFTGSAGLLAVLVLSVIVVPLLGGYGLYRIRLRTSSQNAVGLDAIVAFLRSDWLYVVIERAFAYPQMLIRQALTAMEGMFGLVWAFLWGLAITWYLSGR